MKQKLKDITLTVFSTFKVGLHTHAQTGSLEREMALYTRLAKHLKRINIVTYGGKTDKTYAPMYPDILFLPLFAPSFYQNSLYCLPQLLVSHYPSITHTDVIKTNQIVGSENACLLKQLFHKKLIVRCGYLLSEFAQKNNQDVRQAIRLEKKAFESADNAVVTSPRQRQYVLDAYHLPSNKITVIPNYVDTDSFKPLITKKEFDLVYVGRGTKQKNLENLLIGLSILKKKKLDLTLLMIGSCSENKSLRDIVRRNGINVSFAGNINTHDLPQMLNSSRAFVLPSNFEGHPKALLEAMSCGLPCIGANVEGIKEEINHRTTGYLCETDPYSISEAISTVITDKDLQRRIGINARNYIVKNYDIDIVIRKEFSVLEKLI